MNIAGIILAAGASRRMGTDKALLEYDGHTFLERLTLFLSVSCDSVIIVLGANADRIRSTFGTPPHVSVVVNADWDHGGQLSSLQTGLGSVPPGFEAVMFTPVDYPGIQPETVLALCETWSQRPTGTVIIQPRYQGRHGHPVLFDAGLIGEFLALPRDAQARDVIHKYVPNTVYIDVDDYGTTHDVDDPQAYTELLRADRQPS